MKTKKQFLLFSITTLFFGLTACETVGSSSSKNSTINSEQTPQTFSLLGKWGMISGTITDSDGTKRYGELGKDTYYQYLEYKADGTYIKTTFPDLQEYYGTYVYNASNSAMQYKLDTENYYAPAIVTVHSPIEMTLYTDWGSIGNMSQYLKKIG